MSVGEAVAGSVVARRVFGRGAAVSAGSREVSSGAVSRVWGRWERRRASLAAMSEGGHGGRAGRQQRSGRATRVAWTRAKSAACGQPLASASQTFRVVTRTRAPIFSRERRIVVTCA